MTCLWTYFVFLEKLWVPRACLESHCIKSCHLRKGKWGTEVVIICPSKRKNMSVILLYIFRFTDYNDRSGCRAVKSCVCSPELLGGLPRAQQVRQMPRAVLRALAATGQATTAQGVEAGLTCHGGHVSKQVTRQHPRGQRHHHNATIFLLHG